MWGILYKVTDEISVCVHVDMLVGVLSLCQLQVAPLQEHRCQCQGVSLWLAEQVVSHLQYKMTTKIIHFMVNGRLEQAEFGAESSTADVKGERRLEACYTAQAYILIYLLSVNSVQTCFRAYFIFANNLLLANSLILCCFLHSLLCEGLRSMWLWQVLSFAALLLRRC